MYCKKCNSHNPAGSRKCSVCGAKLEINKTEKDANASGGRLIAGIIMMILGLLSFLGSIVNGSLEKMIDQGFTVSNTVTVLLTVGLVAAGLFLTVSSLKKKTDS